MVNFQSFSGVVTMISDFPIGSSYEDGCYKMFFVEDEQGMEVHFIVEPTTHFVDHTIVKVGDRVVGFYDANVPVPLIYPPQYRAVVMAVVSPSEQVKVDYFDEFLVSSDGQLRLHVTAETPVLLENGQPFTGSLGNRNLIVSYGASTKSIPAQTTPNEIIVLC